MSDYMFISKMLQSDWLYYGTWTIYTFPYRRSGPFIQHLITVKTQVFLKLENNTPLRRGFQRGKEKEERGKGEEKGKGKEGERGRKEEETSAIKPFQDGRCQGVGANFRTI